MNAVKVAALGAVPHDNGRSGNRSIAELISGLYRIAEQS
jgi:hypothetical protein